MVTKAVVNKLTKASLEAICNKYNVEIPKTVKSKANLVDFMVGYSNWTPTLDIIMEETKSQSSASKKSAAKRSGSALKVASIDIDIIDQITKTLDEHTKFIQTIEDLIETKLNKKIISLKDKILKIINEKTSKLVGPSAEVAKKSIYDIEVEVLEAIPENEFVNLEDVFEFIEDVSEEEFKQTIKRLLVFGIIEGQEEEGDLQVKLIDGTVIGIVKKKE